MKKEKVGKTKPKKKFSFWRMLSYVGCYVFVTFAVAFVVVSTNSSTYSFTPPSLDDGPVESSVLGDMVTNIMSLEDMSTTLSFAIEKGGTRVEIDGDVDLKIYEEFSGVEAKANLQVRYDNMVVDLQLAYTDKLYLTYNNKTFALDVNSGIEGVFGILQVIGVDVDLNLDDLMGSLDMSMLDTLGEYITEETLEDGYALNFDYEGISARVVLDNEYNIVEVVAPDICIDGWNIGLDLGVKNTNQGLSFDEMTFDTSLSPLLKLVKVGLNTFKDTNLVFATNLSYGEYAFDFDVLLDNKNFALNTNIAGQNMSLCYKDGVGYGDFGVVKIKGDMDDANKLFDIISDFLPNDMLSGLDVDMDTNTILALVEKVVTENWQITEIDNSIVITYGENQITIEYKNDKITKVGFDIMSVEGCVNIAHCEQGVVAPEGQYISVGDLADFIVPVKNIVLCDRIDLVANINADKTYSGKVVFDKATNRISLNTNMYNKVLALDYLKQNLYLQVDDVKIVTPVQDVFGLIVYVINYFGVDLDVNDLKGALDDTLTLVVVDDTYTFEFAGVKVGFKLDNDTIKNLKIEYNDVVVDFAIELDNDDVLYNLDDYNTVDVSIENLQYIAGLIKDYANGGEYNFDFDLGYDDYSVRGYVAYNNGAFATDLTITAFGYDVRVVVKDENCYVYINDVAISCDFDTLQNLLKYVLNILDIKVEDIKTMLPDFGSVDLEQVLRDTHISYKNNLFEITYKNICVDVDLKLNAIKNISLIYDKISASLTPTYQKTIIIPDTNYINIEDVVGVLESIQQVVENKYITASFNVCLKGIDLSCTVAFDYTAMRASAVVSVLDQVVNIDYCDGKVFVQYDGVKVCCTISDVISLVEDLTGVSFDKQKQSINQIFDNFDKNDFDNLLDKLALLSLAKTIDGYELGYDKYSLTLKTTDGVITAIKFGDIEITFDHTKPVFETINETQYQNIDITYSNITKIIDEVKEYVYGDKYYFEVQLNYDRYSVSGWVGLENGHIVGRLETTVLGKMLQLDIVEDTVYVDFDGLKLSCALEDYSKIAHLIKTEWNISLPSLDLVEPLTMLEGNISFDIDSIKNILDKVGVSNTDMTLNVEYGGVIAHIDLKNYKLNYVDVAYDGITAVVKPTTKQTNLVEGKYIDVASLIDVVKATNKSMANMTMSGVLKVSIVFADEVNDIDINYGITYKNSNLKVYANFTFKGLNVNIYYVDEVVYLDVVGMKFYININDYKDIIGWLNDTFGLKIDTAEVDDLLNTSIDNVKFDFIKDWEICDNYISADLFDNMHIDVYYGDTIEKVQFSAGDKVATITCTSFDELTFASINANEYSKYTVVTNTIDDILNTIKKQSFDITAKALVYEDETKTYEASVALAFDFSKHFKAYGEANVVDLLDENKSVNFITAWDKFDNEDNKDYIFVNYNGMKLRMSESALKEVLSLALQLFGLDPSIMGFLEDVGDDFKVDSSNLNNIMPNLDTGNPLNMLKYIKSLNLKNSQFTLMLNGAFFGEGVADMEIVLHTNNGTITGLDLNNIFVGGTETFNLAISLNKFDGVGSIEDKTAYMDLSGASQLLKAVINTSSKKSYHITGNVKLNLSGMDGLAKVGVDIGVVIDEKGKTSFEATLTNYPLIGLVNSENTNGVGAFGNLSRYRTIKILYKDGYIYLKTIDEEYRSLYSEYTRMTKIPASYLLQNLNYYMQWLLGFKSYIQDAINEAITASQNYTGATDYSNILLDYNLVDTKHTLKLNLQELAHNDQLDTMEVGLTTINTRETGRKDMLSRLDMNVVMLGELIKIATDDEAYLKLVDINKNYDITSAEEFMTAYPYAPFGEYEKKGSGDYSKSNDNDVTITFYNQNNTATTVTGKVGSVISYPSVTQTLEDGRKFKGWYYYANSNKTKLKKWNNNYVPLTDMELYGVWENTYTVTLIDDDQTYKTYTLFKGEKLNLPDIEDRFIEANGVRQGQEFSGWYDGILKRDEITIKSSDITLKSRWKDSIYYQITYIDGDQTSYKWVGANSEVEFDIKPNYIGEYNGERVVFDWKGWTLDGEIVTSLVVENPITLVAKWDVCSMDMAQTLTIMDGEEVVSSTPQLVGYNISLPTHDKINSDTWYFLDKECTQRYYIDTMPETDLTLYVLNSYTVTLNYIESFVDGVAKTGTATYQVRQGASLAEVLPSPSRLNTHGVDGQTVNIFDNNIHRVVYTFEKYSVSYDVMPNCDFEIEELWIEDDRYYYDIVFDTNFNYKPKIGAGVKAQEYVNAPSFTPTTLHVLEDEVIDLSGDEYKPTCSMKSSLIYQKDYVCSGWSLTVLSDGSTTGGETSYTVNSSDVKNGVITLYVCWELK